MTDKPIGLTADERGMLTEALQQLPELLAEAQAMRGTLPPSGGPHTATTPSSNPPCDLSLIACRQNITRAWEAVIRAADEAGATLDSPDVNPDALTAQVAPDLLDLADLAAWIDWYAPCWWARNDVYIPLRQARTALRRITKPATPTTYRCPQCAGPAHTQAGELTWIRCADCGHDAHLPDAVTTTTAASLFGITEPQVRQWAARGKITPTNPGRKPSLWRPRDIIAIIHPERQIAG